MSRTNLDAAFFELVHNAVERDRQGTPRADRHEFRLEQQIAPFYGSIPAREQFHLVTCCDLSTSGFSYFARRPPEFDRLVVVFQSPLGDQNLLCAEVVHVSLLDENSDWHVVGCRFVGRLSDAIESE